MISKNNFVFFFLVKIQHTTHSVIPTEEERNYTKPSRRVSTWYTVSSPMVAQRSPVIRRPGSGCGSSSKLPSLSAIRSTVYNGEREGDGGRILRTRNFPPFFESPLPQLYYMYVLYVSQQLGRWLNLPKSTLPLTWDLFKNFFVIFRVFFK